MADNVATIIINAAADGVLRVAEQVRKKFKDVGEEGGKAGEKLLVNLGKSLLTAGMLIKAAKGIAEAFNEAAANAAKISRETGGKTLASETAGLRLGMSAAQTSAMMGQAGSRTSDEKLQFLNSMVGAKGPGGRAIDSNSAIEMFNQFNSGGQEGDELLGAFSKRGKGGLNATGNAGRLRLGSYSDKARSEMFLRGDTNADAQRISDTAGPVGEMERLRTSKMEVLEAEHSGAFMFRNAVKNAGGSAFVEAGDRLFQETLLEYNRPRLNASGGNGPGGH